MADAPASSFNWRTVLLASSCAVGGFLLGRFSWSSSKPVRTRLGFVMSVNSGDEEEYERRHNPIWTELQQQLSEHGYHNYSIFIHPITNQLFGYVEVDDPDRAKLIANTPVCQKWWKHMGDVMPSNADSSPVQETLKEVFHLD